ncbi:prolipoprotein diacylglyceryl transferase [Luteococcus sanguinis]|uniref:Phosphatidylglycerol--prolipoprotein diacylglyceryl transferase n=1 Tax=Luteococcus sanguinis TaxID=174038 RepID=A0ABW1X659_9ACTN
MLLSLPSPSWSAFHLGPVTIHAYALCILAGIAVAWAWGTRRFVARGGQAETFENITGVAVVFGIVGARLYHVITDYQLYFGPGSNPIDALKIWQGGLGIWGAVALGALGAWIMCRRSGLSFGDFADVVAPTLLVAQAMGRLGNWFNQELFGRPTTLPWGLEIDADHRPAGFTQYATFHPTFLYELVWNLAGAAFLVWAERRWKLGWGRLFALYVIVYCFGRLWVERLRIDTVNTIGGLRLNEYTSVVVFLIGLVLFMWIGRRHGARRDRPFATPAEGSSEQRDPRLAQ